ncbi:MAG: hypothetical protein V1820_06470 [archaeon]
MAKRPSQSEIVGTVVLVAIVLGSIAAAYTWGMPLISKSGDANRIEYVKQTFGRISNDFARVAREGGQSATTVQVDKGEMKIEPDQTDNYVLTYTLSTEMRFFAPRETTIDDSISPYIQKEAWLLAEPISSGTCASGIYTACSKNGTFTSATDLPPEIYGKEVCLCPDNSIKFPGTGQSYSIVGTFFPNVEGTEFRLDAADYANNYASVVSEKYETGTGLLGKDKPGAVLAQSEPIGKLFRTRLKLKPRNIFDPVGSEQLVIKAVPAEGTSVTTRGTFSVILKNEGSTLSIVAGRKVRTVTISIMMK